MSGMQTAPYQDFAREHLGFEFTNIEYLITALTHRSYVNEHKKSVSEHNERLEFLGDAVLELVVTDSLFRNHTEAEGILTSWRASLVRTESIGEAGDKLGFESLIRMSVATMTRQNLLKSIFFQSSRQFLRLVVGVILNHTYKKCRSESITIRQSIKY